MEELLLNELIQESILRIEENEDKIIKCFTHLDETDIWSKPNRSSNSIGNIILHLCGNINQYIVSALGETPDSRNRDSEFSTQGGLAKNELLEKFLKTTTKAKEIIMTLSVEKALRKKQVQAYHLSGLGIILHVVEHLSYHCGQIVYYIKLKYDRDMEFYKDVDLS